VKLALIPPHAYDGDMFRTNYHLLLPQLMTSERYMGIAYELGRNPNDFVILDNGAAEGVTYPTESMFSIADELDVDEIVIPDFMGDAMATIDELHSFMHVAETRDRQFSYMFVAQGQTVDECLWSIDRAGFYSNINTIGLPRHLLQTCGDKNARLTLLQRLIYNFGGRYEVHFLGASVEWPDEARVVGSLFPDQVRGMDTSMPYVYGYYAEWLTDSHSKCVRPEGYFDCPKDDFNEIAVQGNIDQLMRWVYDQEAPVS